MDSKSHWEKTYLSKSSTGVSWYADHLSISLELIHRITLPKTAPIVDVGSGASTLVDDLLKEGCESLTVIDLSSTALEVARKRLQQDASRVSWIEGDILLSDFGGKTFDLWHDRAVFHFLTEESDRQMYKSQVNRHVTHNGYIIMSVFAEDGPEKCSGLTVRRHSAIELVEFFGEGFERIYESKTVHVTPAKVEQRFLNMIFKKVSLSS